MDNSMINPSVNQLLTRIENTYSLVVVTSKRARQIVNGSNTMVEMDSTKPVTLAVNELYQGKVEFETTKSGIK